MKQELTDTNPNAMSALQKRKYLQQFYQPLEREELADTYMKMCLLLPCRLLEINPSKKEKTSGEYKLD